MRNKRNLAFVVALGATGVEVFGVSNGLWDAGWMPLVYGVAVVILQPVIIAFKREARWLVTIASIVGVACVMIYSGGRVGKAIDANENARVAAGRVSLLANETAQDASALIDVAKRTAKAECEKNARSQRCKDATKELKDTFGKTATVRTTIAAAPVSVGHGDIARVAAWTWLPERTVSLYLPLLLPSFMALVASIGWGVWGNRPATVRVTPSVRDVMETLLTVVRPADVRSRVEVADVHRAYREACKATGREVAHLNTCAPAFRLFADKAQLRVLSSGGKVYWCGVRLAENRLTDLRERRDN